MRGKYSARLVPTSPAAIFWIPLFALKTPNPKAEYKTREKWKLYWKQNASSFCLPYYYRYF